jgi:hypothetical protein
MAIRSARKDRTQRSLPIGIATVPDVNAISKAWGSIGRLCVNWIVFLKKSGRREALTGDGIKRSA